MANQRKQNLVSLLSLFLEPYHDIQLTFVFARLRIDQNLFDDTDSVLVLTDYNHHNGNKFNSSSVLRIVN